MTKRPTFLIPSDPILKNGIETDNMPATFWITNPSNDFVDNVAAGSLESGYWFEPLKRGPLAASFPHLNPKRDSIGLFSNNVAHSNNIVSDMKLYCRHEEKRMSFQLTLLLALLLHHLITIVSCSDIFRKEYVCIQGVTSQLKQLCSIA
jgi:hypothetical protein